MHEYVRITRLFINCLTVFVSRDGNRCKNRLLYCLDFKWHNLVICFFFAIWLFLLKSLCVSDPSRQSDSCLRQTICWKDSSSGNFKISISKYWLIFCLESEHELFYYTLQIWHILPPRRDQLLEKMWGTSSRLYTCPQVSSTDVPLGRGWENLQL